MATRLAHMLRASARTCAFLLVSLSAWQVLHRAQRSAPPVMRVG